jgi:hypothetical protein
VNIGAFTAIMSDVDGLGAPASNLYDPASDPLQAYLTSPTLQPGGALPVLMVLEPIRQGAPVQRLTIRENGGQPAQFDLSPITVAGQATTGPVTAAGADTTFHVMDDNFSVRFDGIQPARTNNVLEVFVTFRNVTTRPQMVTLGGYRLSLIGAGGVSSNDTGGFWPARGLHDINSGIRYSPRVEPGAEARLRFWFLNGVPGRPVAVTLTDRTRTLRFPVP